MDKKYLNFKTVVFGGTPKWVKQIQPVMKDAKFFPLGEKPKMAYIKNADVIWVQTFEIDHSTSRAVIQIAKHLNIPVHYFRSKSARECAKDIYRADLAYCA